MLGPFEKVGSWLGSVGEELGINVVGETLGPLEGEAWLGS